jgi:hypothetical protein
VANTVYTPMPIRIGSQPPLKTLTRLAPRNARSTTPNPTAASTICHVRHLPSRRCRTRNSTIVAVIVPVTAMPYAAASFAERSNANTRMSTAASSAQLTNGT